MLRLCICLHLALLTCTVFLQAADGQSIPARFGVEQFAPSKITCNAQQQTTYIKSSDKDSGAFMWQLSGILESQIDVDAEGILRLDLSDWKPAKHREKKIFRLFIHDLNAEALMHLIGKIATVNITIQADREATGILRGEGQLDGKHYHFSQDIRIGTEKSTLSLSRMIPEGLQGLHIRIDPITPAKYSIFNASIQQGGNKEDEVAAAVAEGVNLLTNGDAEWGFYNTMWNNPGLDTIAEVAGSQENVFNGWTSYAIDETVKHSGKRSFRSDGKSGGRMYFAPVPYVVGKKVFLSFYARSEKKETTMRTTLFLANGQAYGGSSIKLDTEWKRYDLDVTWGAKTGNGFNEIGDVVNGYGSLYKLTMPRFYFDGVAWIDDISYSIGSPAPERNPLRELNMLGKIDHPDGLYYEGEGVKADLMLENATEEKATYNLSAQFMDFRGEGSDVDLQASIELNPGEAKPWSFTAVPMKRGSFSLKVTAANSVTGKEHQYVLAGGVVPAEKKAIKRFSADIVAKRNIQFSLPYLKTFGIGSVRVWTTYCPWGSENGEFIGLRDIPMLDQEGMWILLNVSLTDLWRRVPKDMSETIKLWRKGISPVASMVDCFEILNEANIWTNRKPDPAYEDMSSSSYVRVLKAGSQLFKELNPDALIAGPATCHTDVSFTAGVFAAGGGEFLDVVSEHPYRELPELPDFDADIQALRKVVAGKPIYSTECGRQFPAIMRDNQPSEFYQDKLAEIVRLHLIAFGCGNELYTNFAWEVRPVGMAWQFFMGGSPNNNGMPRPAPVLYATRAMADVLGDAPTLGRIRLGHEYRAYLFQKDSKRIVALWKHIGSPSTIDLSTIPAKTELLDMMGNPLDITHAPLSQFPVYIITEASEEVLRSCFTDLDLEDSGNPVSADLQVLALKKAGVKITNLRNRAVSGSVTLADQKKQFSLGPEEVGLVDFYLTDAITTTPRMMSAMVDTGAGGKPLQVTKDLHAMFAGYTGKDLTIDGDLSDWPKADSTELNYTNSVRYIDWTDDEKKVNAKVQTAWNENNLYVAVTVYKQGFYPTEKQSVWEGDGLQIAFDTTCNSKKGVGYEDDDFEYGIALQNGKAEVYRRQASSASHDSLAKEIGKLDGNEVNACIMQYPDRQVYELAFGRRSVSPFRLGAGNIMKWDLIVNMSNGKQRIGYLEITPGIGKDKDPYQFIPLLLNQ